MTNIGFERKTAPFELLTPDQVNEIHQATLKVLADTGVTFENEKALNLLKDRGCIVDFEQQRVRFPKEIVEAFLSKVPKEWEVSARDPRNNWHMKSDSFFFISGCGMQTIDLDTGEVRDPTRKEFYDFVKVLDALPNCHALGPFPWWGFDKVPQAMRLIESNAAKIRMSTKVQEEGSVHDNYRWNLEMAKATGQDLINFANPVSPLNYNDEVCEIIDSFARLNLIFDITTAPLMGSTGPATIAGALITNNAETIAGMILTQILKPGTRVHAGHMTFMTDMKSGEPAFGDISNSLHASAFSQMWRHYGIPKTTAIPAWTASNSIDYQAGSEIVSMVVLCALSGFNATLLHGGLAQEKTAHPIKAVLDDDIAGMVGRLIEGVEVSEETTALDLIEKVGPIPGSYLAEDHTFKWWKKEQYLTLAADRVAPEKWSKEGSKKAIDYARDKMGEIISSHKSEPLTPGQEQAIEDILRDAREYYRKKGLITEEEWTLYQEDLNSPDYPYA